MIATEPLSLLKPRCSHAPSCGGCSFQEVPYELQLAKKQLFIEQTFQALVESNQTIRPIVGCQDPWRYRNKMEFTFSQNRAGDRYLGLMLKQSRGKVFNLEECHLTSTWMAEALCATRKWWEASSLSAYNPRRDEGTLRNLTLREGQHTKEKMAFLTVSGREEYAISRKHLNAWVAVTKKTFDGPISCFLRIQQAYQGMATQFYELHLDGPEHIHEEIEVLGKRLNLQISPTSFFQPNTVQAGVLYTHAIEMLDPMPTAHVFDLYCGMATIGMSIAPYVAHVTAIELNPYAIMDAEANLAHNKIDHLTLLKGDAAQVLASLKAQKDFRPPDAVIVDPPRSGLGSKATALLSSLQSSKILYISCNPSTQAEDIKLLLQEGYKIKLIQPVDQFPHTRHIENIVLLER